ncbi:MAG TPA: LysM peptidoglycan-binding domain-containing protein, partial [Polyangia bacterium]
MIVDRRFLAAAVMVPVAASATAAYAQQAAPPSGSEVTTTTTTTVQAPTPSTQPGSTYLPQMQYGNPQSDNGTIGGGNATESSSLPITGAQEDTFDFKPGAHGGRGAVHGSENGPVFSGRVTMGGEVPNDHTVRRGDTLWGISDFYFKNPYQWPRLWSYNPQIKNPNWIYP